MLRFTPGSVCYFYLTLSHFCVLFFFFYLLLFLSLTGLQDLFFVSQPPALACLLKFDSSVKHGSRVQVTAIVTRYHSVVFCMVPCSKAPGQSLFSSASLLLFPTSLKSLSIYRSRAISISIYICIYFFFYSCCQLNTLLSTVINLLFKFFLLYMLWLLDPV